MGRKRKSLASESKPRQDKRKKRRRKHRLSLGDSAGTMKGKDISKKLDTGCDRNMTNNVVGAEISKKNIARSAVMGKNEERPTFLDETVSLKDGSASHVVRNDSEVRGAQKLYGNDPSEGMSDVVSPEVHLETAGGMNVKSSDGKKLKSMKSRNAKKKKVKNNCNDNFAKENVSGAALQFVEDGLTTSDPSLLNAVGVVLERKNFNESTTSESTNNGVEEVGIHLAVDAKIASMKNDASPRKYSNSGELKYYKSRSKKRVDNKGQNKLNKSEPVQGDAPISLQVTPISSSADTTSLSKTGDILLKKKKNEASNSNTLIVPAKGEGLSRSSDAVVAKSILPPEVHSNACTLKSDKSLEIDSSVDTSKSDMFLGIDSHSAEVKHANTKQRKKHRKRRKNGARQNDSVQCPAVFPIQSNTSANSSTFLVSDEVDIARDETSTGHSVMPQLRKESGGLSEDASANSIRSGISSEIKLNPVIVKSFNPNDCKKARHKEKREVFDYQYKLDLDRDDPSASSSVIGTAEMQAVSPYDVDASTKNNLIRKVSIEDVGLTKSRDIDSQDGSNVTHEVYPGYCQGERPISAETKDSEKKTKENSDHISTEAEQLKVNASGTSLQDVISGDAHMSNMTSTSAKVPADRSEVVSLPPSPIRGVINDIASPNLPVKQNNLLSPFREEDSFSFQITDDVPIDGPSVNHSEKACRSSHGVGPENGKSCIHKNNAADASYMCNHSERSGLLEEKEVASSSMSYVKEDVAHKQEKCLDAMTVSQEGAIVSHTTKLLVLDLNGLLADVSNDFRNVQNAHTRVGRKAVFKRPFCDDFLKFCFERFDVGVWSSRRKINVDGVVDYLMQDMKHKLLFCWDLSKCTETGCSTIENAHKPLVLKELKKLWNKEEPDLPWEKGDYSPSNTLLVDDSPYKALCNPPHTAIFPYPYHFNDENDNSLGPGGDLRVYLEGLAMAEDVQKYIQEHPFGQRAITPANPSWKFYLRIIEKFKNSCAPT